MIFLFAFLFAAFALSPDPAAAAPVVGALTTFFTSLGVGAAFAASLATFAVQAALGVAFSLVSQLFVDKPKIRQQGIQTEQTTTGDTTPQKFVVGRYALEGHAIAPAYSHGPDNTLLTYILEVSNVPINGLTERVAIDGQWYEYDTENAHADYGFPFPDLYHAGSDRAWIKFYDGTQTEADPMLVDKYGAHPDRPWTEEHIVEGSAYAVLTFYLSREIFSGLPAVRFEVDGISLYDPRKDSTVGGSGAHRWADPATWEFTKNPQVINYNVLRGITMPSGDIYGGQVSPEDLPLASWFAAMNACDALIGARVTYEAGFEVDVSIEPFDVLQEMNRASFTQISEFGGIFVPRTGAPAAPVLSMTDADIVITQPEELEPFPGLAGTNNAITGTYIEPNDVWQGREADPIYNAEWEADDGDRRLTRDMSLPAVSNKSQAQHLLNSYINDERRFRTHRLVLPSSYAVLEPLDTISWTSSYNGYTSKVFEVVEVEDRLDTMLQFLTIREREASDVAWSPGDDVPAPASVIGVESLTPAVPMLGVVAYPIQDGQSNDRRPGIRITWDEADAGDNQSLIYQVRVEGSNELVANGTVDVGEEKAQITEGLLPGETYEVRARFVTGNAPVWSGWVQVIAPDIRPTLDDLDDSVTDVIANAQQVADDAKDNLDTLTEDFVGNLKDAFSAVDRGSSVLSSQTDIDVALFQGYQYAGVSEANLLFPGGTQRRWVIDENDPATDVGGAQTYSDNFRWFGQENAEHFFVELDVTLISGTLEGAGVDAVWYNTGAGSYVSRLSLSEMTGEVSEFGVPTRFTCVLSRPSDYVGPFDRVRFQFIAAWPFFDGEDGASKEIVLHRVAIRPIADPEVRALNTEANLSQNYLTTTDINSALAALDTDLSAEISGLSDDVTAISADLALNYYTAADTNGAISAAAASLTADYEADDLILAGAIDDILGLEVSGSTAFGTLLTQLNVSAGGVSALLNDYGSAIVDLEGFAQASIGATAEVVTVNGTEYIAGFRATSYADPDGSGGSLFQIWADDIVADGSMSVGKLNVGLGKNLLGNTDFVAGTEGWFFAASGDQISETELILRAPGDFYAGTSYPTLFLYQDGAGTSGIASLVYRPETVEGTVARGVPCAPGEWVEVSARFAAIRCSGYVRAIFYNSANGLVGVAQSPFVSSNISSDNPSLWDAAYIIAQAPANTAYATIEIRKTVTSSGADSGLYVHEPQLVKTHANATEMTPYSRGGQTLITGDMIKTGTVVADRLQLDGVTLTGDGSGNLIIAANGVSRPQVADGAVSDGGVGYEPTAGTYIAEQTVDPPSEHCNVVVGVPILTEHYWQIVSYGEIRSWGQYDNDTSEPGGFFAGWTQLSTVYRTKSGGVWSGWQGVNSGIVNFNSFVIVKHALTVQGDYEDMEVAHHIVTNAVPSEGEIVSTQTNYRNGTVAARALVR